MAESSAERKRRGKARFGAERRCPSCGLKVRLTPGTQDIPMHRPRGGKAWCVASGKPLSQAPRVAPIPQQKPAKQPKMVDIPCPKCGKLQGFGTASGRIVDHNAPDTDVPCEGSRLKVAPSRKEREKPERARQAAIAAAHRPAPKDLAWFESTDAKVAMHQRTAYHVRVARRLLRFGEGDPATWGYLVEPMTRFLEDTEQGRRELFEIPRSADPAEAQGRHPRPCPLCGAKVAFDETDRMNDHVFKGSNATCVASDRARGWMPDTIDDALPKRLRTGGPVPPKELEWMRRTVAKAVSLHRDGKRPVRRGPGATPEIKIVLGGSPGLGKRR